MTKRPSFFYGWVIVCIAAVSMTLVMGVRHSFSVFFPPILDEFGWSRGSTALMLSLNLLFYGLMGPIAGSLGDTWKPRRVMFIGIIILSLATAGCTFARELWHFYILFGILAPVGMAFSSWPLLAPALANWFAKRRGLAIGLGHMGSGLSFIYSMFAEVIISQLGWRSAYLVLAGTLVVFLLPLCFLFYYHPENKGLKAYGTAELPTTNGSTAKLTTGNSVLGDWTLGQAMKTYQLWLLVLSHFLYWGLGAYLVLAHQVKFTEDAGYSSLFSAFILALFGVFMTIGRLSAFISDWLGREMTITIAIVLSIVALVALVSVRDASQPWLLYVYAICFGYGVGLYSPTIIAATADIFYGRHFGAIAGLLITGVGIGGAIGPWLGGYIYDISGSYIGGFILCMVCFGLVGINFWIAAPRNAAKLRAKT